MGNIHIVLKTEVKMAGTVRRNVKFSEIDENGELSFGKIVDYIQDCSSYESECLGLGVEHQNETGRAWILSSWYIRINGKIKHKDEVEVSTWASSFTKITGCRNYTIKFVGEDYNLVEAKANWVMFDMKKQSIARIAPEDIEKYELEPPLDMPELPRRIKSGETYERKEGIKVQKYHLDINRHMNNAWYIKLAEEFIDNKEKINVIRAEYKNSAKYNELIIPFVCREEDRYVIELRNENNDIYAVIEFRNA